ncbi:hypothetical protein D3C87_796080 [compost metagenome]
MVATRTLMAKGSKWIVNADFTAENHYGAEYQWQKNARGGQDLVQVKKRDVDFKKGEIITITDKSSTYHPRTYDKGIFYPITVEGRKGDGCFSLKDISEHLDLHEEVLQLIWVFYSAKMGGYIEKIPYSTYHDGDNYEAAQKTGGVLFNPKITKAMKKKRSQDTKQFLLSHSGYYDGIDTSDIYYVFEPGGKKVDFPDDLVIQELNKITKEVRAESKASDYLTEAFRLRPLTLKYGSSIRSVFKDMEEKGENYTTLLMFQDTDEDVDQYDKSKPIEQLKAEFKEQKLAKGTYIMKSDYRTVSFAFKNRNDALMFRLGYSGSLPSKLVDAETLAEVSK